MERVKFKDILQIKHGYAFKGEFFTDEDTGQLILTPGNFTLKGGFQETKKFTTEKDFPSEFVLKSGDLIVTMTDLSKAIDTIGFSALVPNNADRKYLHNQRIGLVKVLNPEFDKDYVYWVMRTGEYQRTIANTSNGATVHHTSPDRIYKYWCRKFPLSAQRKIASILSVYDSLIENNTKRIRLLEQMAENLYKEWFVRFRFPGHENTEFVDGLPKGWIIEKVSSIVKRLPFNRTYKKHELQDDGKVIVIDQSTDAYLGFHNDEPSHLADYSSPLIIFGDHSCKFQLMTMNFSLGENVIPFTSNKNITNEYWLFYATHKLIQTEEYKRHWGRFSSMKVILPHLRIQNLFAEIVEKFEREKNSLLSISKILAKQRDALLPRLMSGKLEVKA